MSSQFACIYLQASIAAQPPPACAFRGVYILHAYIRQHYWPPTDNTLQRPRAVDTGRNGKKHQVKREELLRAPKSI
eukprot:scaffold192023_cov41-Prasinocladus_malaysianus.AAC.1